MRTKIIVAIFAAGLFFAATNPVKAIVAPLPEENNPFWNIMVDMQTPDDADCITLATAELAETLYEGQEATLCAGIQNIMNMQASLADAGVETNLFDQTDWHNINGLYFEIAGLGKIEFTNSIDFMSYDFLTLLSTLTERMSMSQGEIGLDADIVGGLSGYGAVLTMYNAGDFNDPEILVDGEGDSEGVVSGLEYDPITHDITFDAAHFTTFKATEKSSGEKKPKITNIDYEKYKTATGVEMIKITMKGKNFKKKTDVTLGGKDASKVTYRTSKKIIAHFKISKLLATGKIELKLKAFNGKKMGKYRNKLLLSELI